MKTWLRNHLTIIGLVSAAALAASAGAFAAVVVAGASQQAPTKTVTINAGEGATGPAGPPGPAGATGPAGPAGAGGADQCPTGSTFQAVVIVSPGGPPVEIWACVKG
jgi:hypothetical protein